MKSYLAHHTCSMGGGYQKVMKESPFLSKWPKEDDEDPREPYLGEGYYFWQNDMKQAQKWGRLWYTNWYYVVEANINTTDENFLDLVGDPFQAAAFLLGCSKVVAAGGMDPDFTLGEAIEYFKKASKTNKPLFPWSIIRGKDDKAKQEKYYFKKKGGGYMYFGGNLIFCLIEKNDVILTNKRIAYQSLV